MRRRKFTPNRTVQGEIEILLDLGFTYDGTNSSGHHLLSHPVHGEVQPMSSTPRNDHAWRRRHRAEIASLMGLNLWKFERLIAGQSLERTGPKRRRRQPRAAKRPVSLLCAVAVAAADPSECLAPVPDRALPGSAEAVAAGCWCPVFENRKGLGLEGRDGVFAYVVGCPVHQDESREAA